MPAIRICLIGDFTPNPDEGMRKSAVQLRDALAKRSELLCLNPIEALKSREIGKFEPDFIQYVSGPSPASLAILKLLKFRVRKAKTVSMMTHPQHVRSGVVWRIMAPDMVLTFSPDWKQYLSRFKTNAMQIPGAVDTSRFRPVGMGDKKQIRKDLGLPDDEFIALHVGHLRRGRGLARMAPLKSKGILPVVVASKSTGQDKGFKKELTDAGFVVVDEYVSDIERYYQASDCYVFPTLVGWRGMDLPLSVIEAMACNLPVVSMDFGSIGKQYGGVQGVSIVRSDEELVTSVSDLRTSGKRIETRKAVESSDWENLANAILSLFEGA